ncbi:efflux RND transporter periplasmic adaptor subunit [Iodobacter fluviatilis]|uniref:Cation efflux system protein CusB n=1 Tax=Iodobacter fluviatilis TaxID=537 RepID=A0A377QAV4_9NEIS|nr:efflux RND transporter periplasmic adaptor subunit [Iodobacter fluviatilis]TCU81409.1 Cu(I)/Ag(I) efflux system membrane fusion protein [Iodobacter fluviatilis]STQ91947.1 Cation efflux system protein CusB precursor [Iodobacter fluviatilis]
MTRNSTIALAIAALFIGTAAGWWLKPTPNHATASAPVEARKALYWYDPMKPEQHFDQPGKSPFMDMELVPRYADTADSSSSTANASIKINPSLTQNTGLKLATAQRGTISQGIEVPGSVVFNDRDVAIVQARSNGIVERVYPLASGDIIQAGTPIAEVRVPEWLAAQNEYLALRHDAELAGAMLSRLQQLGMSTTQITRLKQSGQPQATITITAPRSGMIAELSVRQGMVLSLGAPLARINGLSSVWIEAEVPEAQAATLKIGAPIHALFTAQPNAPISGKVTALVPELNKETRSLRVRAEVPNPKGLLRPGMFARIALDNPDSSSALLVPSESIIATGKRSVVIMSDGQGRFTPSDVKTGREHQGQTEIISGLKEGEQIVVSGQFMIDSEASLRGVLARMNPAASAATSAHSDHATTAPVQATHQGQGIVKAIDSKQITLEHGAIASLNWPAMTMPFPLATPNLAKGIRVGQQVNFSFIEQGSVVQNIKVVATGGQP